MPKVSEEHLEQRRQQILEAAQACFARQGFYATSMQDIFKESGLSAGAVYRYFPSKAEIVRAIATRNRGNVVAYLEGVLQQDVIPSVPELVGGFAAGLERGMRPGGPLTAAPQGWAVAIYDDEIGPIVKGLFSDTRNLWIKVAERLKEEGRLPADADAHAVGSSLFCIVPGFVLQKLLLKDVEASTLVRGFEALLAGSA